MVSSSDTLLFRHRRSGGLRGARREDQIYLCEQPLCWLFDLSFCLVKALLPLRLPYPCFSVLQLYSITSNGMAYLIRYAWADSLIEAASLLLSFHLFRVGFFFSSVTPVLLLRDQCIASCLLTLPPHPCLLYFLLRCNTAPSGELGFCIGVFFVFFSCDQVTKSYQLITLFQFIVRKSVICGFTKPFNLTGSNANEGRLQDVHICEILHRAKPAESNLSISISGKQHIFLINSSACITSAVKLHRQ